MPPLNQPKDLSYLSLSTWSLLCAKCIKSSSEAQIQVLADLFDLLPAAILESAGPWILQSAGSLLRCVATEDQLGLDDKEVVSEQIEYLRRCLRVILHPKLKIINLELTIDMRTFQNFTNSSIVDIDDEDNDFDDLRNLVVVTDHEVDDFHELNTVSQFLAEFIGNLKNDHELKMFDASFYLIDRDCTREVSERKVSLTWVLPTVLINVVGNCHQLTHLNLEYYHQLTDLGLEYIAGVTTDQTSGLTFLEEIILPKESYITKDGIKVLIENLSELILIENAGRLGEVLEIEDLSLPGKRGCYLIVELDQTEGVAVEEDEDDFERDEVDIVPWIPSSSAIQRIESTCPNLKRLKLWCNDESLASLASGLYTVALEELDFNFVSEDILGLELFLQTFGKTLTSIKLCLPGSCALDFIQIIGTNCHNVGLLHLEFSTSIIDYNFKRLQIREKEVLFPNLQDLKVKTIYCDSDLPKELFHYLLAGKSDLSLVEFNASMTWISHPDIAEAFSRHRSSLEMVILADPYSSINLSMESVHFFVDNFPKLTALGNLSSWKYIDYFNPNSGNFYKTESELSQLKRRARKSNWNLDFDVETLPVC